MLRYFLAFGVSVGGDLNLGTVVVGVAVAEQLAGIEVNASFLQRLDLNEIKEWCDWWCHRRNGLQGFPFGWLFLVAAAKAMTVTVVVTGEVVFAVALRAGFMPQELGWHRQTRWWVSASRTRGSRVFQPTANTTVRQVYGTAWWQPA